jgi:methylated-DNA-protein-cysteine methyltransferase related protein
MKLPPNADQFFMTVWDIVKQVPRGTVTTYGQIASMMPPPDGVEETTYTRYGAQWVGQAMNASPEDVPWQRVINSKGEISLPEPTGTRQRELLEGEGVKFDGKGRVNFEIYAWDGPEDEWLQEQGFTRPNPLRKKKIDQPQQPTLF